MVQALFYDVLILNEGNDVHLPEALEAGEEVSLVYFPDKSCPIFPGFPGGFIRFQNSGYQFILAFFRFPRLTLL
jgi:hypothetical protein